MVTIWSASKYCFTDKFICTCLITLAYNSTLNNLISHTDYINTCQLFNLAF